MTKTVKDVKRPSPTREPRSVRYLHISQPITKRYIQWTQTHAKADRQKGLTFDIRRNEWKRLKRHIRAVQMRGESPARVMPALDRVHQIERAWSRGLVPSHHDRTDLYRKDAASA